MRLGYSLLIYLTAFLQQKHNNQDRGSCFFSFHNRKQKNLCTYDKQSDTAMLVQGKDNGSDKMGFLMIFR